MRYQSLPDWKTRPELSRLLDLSDPPKNIHIAGTYDSTLFARCVAVVGSRRITEYGKRALELIIPKLVFEKKTIVSGFMYGVDQYAHELAIKNGGKTIAVLGWGIGETLEDRDKTLADQIIASGGFLISEWEHQRPTLWTFPVRNRIVAALCSDVIVVEAAQKSGSLITARLARNLKRAVWAIPGPITSKTSAGTNHLIASGCAKMWIDVPVQERLVSDDPVINALAEESKTADELARFLGKSVSEVGAAISMYVLSGDVLEEGGKYRAR